MTLEMTETSRKGKRRGSLITVAEYNIFIFPISMICMYTCTKINVHTNT